MQTMMLKSTPCEYRTAQGKKEHDFFIAESAGQAPPFPGFWFRRGILSLQP
jgi:hypothetical protein